jgi:hypothetical protein
MIAETFPPDRRIFILILILIVFRPKIKNEIMIKIKIMIKIIARDIALSSSTFTLENSGILA